MLWSEKNGGWWWVTNKMGWLLASEMVQIFQSCHNWLTWYPLVTKFLLKANVNNTVANLSENVTSCHFHFHLTENGTNSKNLTSWPGTMAKRGQKEARNATHGANHVGFLLLIIGFQSSSERGTSWAKVSGIRPSNRGGLLRYQAVVSFSSRN